MKVLVTGYKGFVGSNVSVFLKNRGHFVLGIDKDNINFLEKYLDECDYVIHLAGAIRPLNKQEFIDTNINITKRIADYIKINNLKCPIIFASSIQVNKLDNEYSRSKKQAEDYLKSSNIEAYIFRLSNVFGKWAKPNYSSVVATFCYNISRNLPIHFSDEKNIINMVYIDDVCNTFIDLIEGKTCLDSKNINEVRPIYTKTLRQIADTIFEFKKSRNNITITNQGDSYCKKMYATYLSYLPENEFSYSLEIHADERGSFTEFIKTKDSGQVSINVIKPGIKKGNHYHNTKNEKFLVVSGNCLIKFRKINSKKIIEYKVSGNDQKVVDIPTGYTHNITNIGEDNSVVIIWVNEPFDKDNPDTFFEEV